ncbi:site-2 protease family protein, partial [Patescibacteria group bacterium]|nr:site-2 protease family protein [Patescibacteria group bacterium]
LYSFNLLPFGGFVKLYGEDEDATDSDAYNNISHNPRSFISKSAKAKVAIITAGVLMNFALAMVTYFVLFLFTGFKSMHLPAFFDYTFRFGEPQYTRTVIAGFAENSPAEVAGIQLGEAIVKVGDISVSNIEEVRTAVASKVNQSVPVEVKDLRDPTNSKTRIASVIPTSDAEGNGILGVYLSSSTQISYANKLLAPFLHSYNMLAYTGSTLGKFVNLSFATKSVEPISATVSGPVGIYSVVDIILSFGGKGAFLGLLDFIALMSLTLAFINILPLPALDGGRLAFIVLEAIIGKKLHPSIEANVHKWGMIFFFGILILISVKDVLQFF